MVIDKNIMTADDISEADPWQLVQAISECGKYAFLIGAGTSRPSPAEIKTAGELIEEWQKECYERADPSEDDLEEWVKKQEKEGMEYDQGEYGFWFEKRHPTRGERRNRIDDLVRDADPTPGHITLASMMSERYVPHILTPNFDDLLFDAFYLFLEDKPNLIDHRAVAPEFKLTREDPTIVKLHGDYLYDNLQNTDSETKALEPAMEDALQQTVTEYGLVVVGYGGTDESIMDPLLEADISEYGIYWCVRDTDEISPKVGELLEQPNTHLVEIKGFLNLMETFYQELNDVEFPELEDLRKRAEERSELLEWSLEESAESVEDGEEGAFEHALNRLAAQRAVEKGQYTHAIELLDDALEERKDAGVYFNRGNAKAELERYEDAIEDYDQAIEHDPELAEGYYNRGNAKVDLERYEDAIEDYDQAIEHDPELAKGYYNRGNAKAELERYEDAIEDYDQAIKLDSKVAEGYYNRGYAKAELERYEDAIEDYNQAIEHDPESAKGYNNRGVAKLCLERFEEAIHDFTQSIERKDSETVSTYTNRAEARLLNGDFESAQEDALIAQSKSTSTENQAIGLLLELITKILLDEEHSAKKEEYLSICDEEFTTNWDFAQIDSWVDDVPAEKRDGIETLINLLREFKED